MPLISIRSSTVSALVPQLFVMFFYGGAGPMDVFYRVVIPGIAAVVMLGYIGYVGTSYLEQPQLRPDLVTLRATEVSRVKADTKTAAKAQAAPTPRYDGSSLGPEISF